LLSAFWGVCLVARLRSLQVRRCAGEQGRGGAARQQPQQQQLQLLRVLRGSSSMQARYAVLLCCCGCTRIPVGLRFRYQGVCGV
jgi:hypothetical protein